MRTFSITTKERKLLNKLLKSYLDDIDLNMEELEKEVGISGILKETEKVMELLQKFED
jgi:DNA-binding transcriptional regulator WhiA